MGCRSDEAGAPLPTQSGKHPSLIPRDVHGVSHVETPILAASSLPCLHPGTAGWGIQLLAEGLGEQRAHCSAGSG